MKKWSKSNRIEIQEKKLYRNKSYVYLLNSIKKVNKALFVGLKKDFKLLAAGIGDMSYEEDFTNDKFFILVSNNNGNPFLKGKFSNFLDSFREHPSYVGDYQSTDVAHMLVVNLPFPNMKDKFLKGKYSEIYESEELIKSMFPKIAKRDGVEDYFTNYLVLTKDPRAKAHIKRQLEYHFGYTVGKHGEIPGSEFDLPPILGEEIFNYK